MRVSPRRPTSLLGRVGALVLMFVFVGVIGSCAITIGIWPGEIKLLAPLFCSDAQPDAFVVADTYSPQHGETVTNFSLYCMGPRGDATDKGFMWPFLAISAVNGAVIFAVLIVLGKLLKPRDRDPDPNRDPNRDANRDANRAPAATPFGQAPLSPGSTAGPFVD